MAEQSADRIISPAITRSPQYRSVYVNQARAGISTWDIQITFGRMVEVAPGVPAVEEQLTAVLSPEYAKALIEVLQETVKQFEEKIGPVTRHPKIGGGVSNASLDEIAKGAQIEVG